MTDSEVCTRASHVKNVFGRTVVTQIANNSPLADIDPTRDKLIQKGVVDSIDGIVTVEFETLEDMKRYDSVAADRGTTCLASFSEYSRPFHGFTTDECEIGRLYFRNFRALTNFNRLQPRVVLKRLSNKLLSRIVCDNHSSLNDSSTSNYASIRFKLDSNLSLSVGELNISSKSQLYSKDNNFDNQSSTVPEHKSSSNVCTLLTPASSPSALLFNSVESRTSLKPEYVGSRIDASFLTPANSPSSESENDPCSSMSKVELCNKQKSPGKSQPSPKQFSRLSKEFHLKASSFTTCKDSSNVRNFSEPTLNRPFEAQHFSTLAANSFSSFNLYSATNAKFNSANTCMPHENQSHCTFTPIAHSHLGDHNIFPILNKSSIPFIFKCFEFGDCQDPKSCAKACELFKLYLKLTIGRNRVLSKSIVDFLESINDSPVDINKTKAFIAASAAEKHPVNIFLPANERITALAPSSKQSLNENQKNDTTELSPQNIPDNVVRTRYEFYNTIKPQATPQSDSFVDRKNLDFEQIGISNNHHSSKKQCTEKKVANASSVCSSRKRAADGNNILWEKIEIKNSIKNGTGRNYPDVASESVLSTKCLKGTDSNIEKLSPLQTSPTVACNTNETKQFSSPSDPPTCHNISVPEISKRTDKVLKQKTLTKYVASKIPGKEKSHVMSYRYLHKYQLPIFHSRSSFASTCLVNKNASDVGQYSARFQTANAEKVYRNSSDPPSAQCQSQPLSSDQSEAAVNTTNTKLPIAIRFPSESKEVSKIQHMPIINVEHSSKLSTQKVNGLCSNSDLITKNTGARRNIKSLGSLFYEEFAEGPTIVSDRKKPYKVSKGKETIYETIDLTEPNVLLKTVAKDSVSKNSLLGAKAASILPSTGACNKLPGIIVKKSNSVKSVLKHNKLANSSVPNQNLPHAIAHKIDNVVRTCIVSPPSDDVRKPMTFVSKESNTREVIDLTESNEMVDEDLPLESRTPQKCSERFSSTNATLPYTEGTTCEYAVMCKNLPGLGYLNVQRLSNGNLLLNDKAITSNSRMFRDFSSLENFLNRWFRRRLGHMYQGNPTLDWVLVTAGVLKVINVSHFNGTLITNPEELHLSVDGTKRRISIDTTPKSGRCLRWYRSKFL